MASQSLFHQVFFPLSCQDVVSHGAEVAIPFSSGLLSFKKGGVKWKRKNVAIPFSSGLLSFSDRQGKLYISMVAIPFSSGLLSFDIGRLVSWRLRVAIPFSSGLLSFQFWEGTFKEFVSRNPFFIRSSFLSAIASYCKEISGSQSLFHQVFFPLDAAEIYWLDVWSQSLFHQVFFPFT